MRLVSYNILDGGEGRADPLAEVIEAQSPDIVALVEADNADVVDRIAGRLKMDVIRVEGRKHGVAILTRWALRDSINHGLMHDEFEDSVLEATIAEPGGRTWTIAAVHLHPRAAEADEKRREKEIEALLHIFADRRAEGRPHLLAGDFNANSPIQKIDPDQCKPRTREEIKANGGVLPRRAVARLLLAGYVDTLAAVRGDEAATTGSFTTLHPGQRVDYIFAHGIPADRLVEARVEQDRLARYASDHFPIVLQVN